MSVTKIVITGGPCAGKSTAMSRIQAELSDRGYTVLFVPETATELITGGVAPWTCKTNAEYQKLQMRLQLEKERIFERAASGMPAEDILIVCDRGLMDNMAYMNDAECAEVLSEMGMSEGELLMEYDAVFHLVSAAKGAAEFYTTANNAARRESTEEASRLDDRIIAAWDKHPSRTIIDNSRDFDTKMRELLKKINEFLTGSSHARRERKLLIEYPDTSILDTLPGIRRFEIVQTYLISDPDDEVRVRRRRDGESYTYLLTTRRLVNGIRRIQLEERISAREYRRLLLDSDPTRHPLHKTRYCFNLGGTYAEIDIYPFFTDRALLYLEMLGDEEPVLPEWIKVIEDVTDAPEYKNATLAKNYTS